jgi:hypothetical protein
MLIEEEAVSLSLSLSLMKRWVWEWQPGRRMRRYVDSKIPMEGENGEDLEMERWEVKQTDTWGLLNPEWSCRVFLKLSRIVLSFSSSQKAVFQGPRD